AIRSHRWPDGGEPAYEDMLRMTRRQVRDTRKPRKRYGIQWSDTCCIEKSDRTELDDSIRSMLRWYRNSTICIVHLA
ncbi:hypothetical protein P692DRAFT_20659416, partial [Suillus brevipes Sb2]